MIKALLMILLPWATLQAASVPAIEKVVANPFFKTAVTPYADQPTLVELSLSGVADGTLIQIGTGAGSRLLPVASSIFDKPAWASAIDVQSPGTQHFFWVKAKSGTLDLQINVGGSKLSTNLLFGELKAATPELQKAAADKMAGHWASLQPQRPVSLLTKVSNLTFGKERLQFEVEWSAVKAKKAGSQKDVNGTLRLIHYGLIEPGYTREKGKARFLDMLAKAQREILLIGSSEAGEALIIEKAMDSQPQKPAVVFSLLGGTCACPSDRLLMGISSSGAFVLQKEEGIRWAEERGLRYAAELRELIPDLEESGSPLSIIIKRTSPN